MKKILKLSVLLGIMSLAFFGCKAEDVQTKEECLDDFFSKAEAGSWTTMYKEIHPDNVNRNTYKNGVAFNDVYDPAVTYSISSKSGDTYYLTVSPDGVGTGTEKFVFRAEEGDGFLEGDTWLIYSFTDGDQADTY